MKSHIALALTGLLLSTTAFAAPPMPSSVTVPVTLEADATDPATLFGDIAVRKTAPNQSFDDYYTFHLDGLSDVSFAVVSNVLLNAAGNVTLKAVNFDAIKLLGPNDFQGTGTISVDALRASVGFKNLVAGDYTVTLLGHSVGKSGGSYYGEMSVTAAVPEPEALAMGLAGLGVIGLIARRRKAD
jgi:MYXO-CTERM domain-containing protein